MMWQDNTLIRVTLLEDKIEEQALAIQELTKLVNEIAELVVLQTHYIKEMEYVRSLD